MNISILMDGIAFSAMSTNHLNLDNNHNSTKETSKIEDIQYSYKTSNTNGTIVEFRDPTNGKNVSVSLNDNVLDKLKSHFSSQDFNKNEDASLNLSGEAEKFISGWFGDIAYKRKFLSADKNQDGSLDSDEYLNTNNNFTEKKTATLDLRKDSLSFTGHIEQTYTKSEINNLSITTNIDKELNNTLRLDKNFDSNVSLVESMRNNIKNDTLGDRATVIKNFKDDLVNAPINIQKLFNDALSGFNKNIEISSSSSKNKEEELKKLEALMKLLQANGDASKLTASEREILGSELQKYTKDITKELSDSLSTTLDKKIVNELDEKTQISHKEDKKLQTLEKLQQNNSDTSKLSKEEKELITTEIEKSKKEDGNIDKDKLQEIINYNKTSKVYNEVEASQMVGKYYEEKG